MQLLASWRDSLKMVYPLNNLKLFVFATLRALQVAAPSFGVLLIGALIVYQGLWYVIGGRPETFLLGRVAWLVYTAGLFFVDSLIYFLVRPSVDRKDIGYWYGHRWHLFSVLVLDLFVSVFVWLGLVMPTRYLFDENSSVLIMVFVLVMAFALVLLLVSAVLVAFCMPLLLFFLFDSRGGSFDVWRAFLRAIRMVLYNIPLWAMFFCVITLFLQAKYFFGVGFLGASAVFVFSMIVKFIAACAWSVFYTKRLHEQFELYFPVKK